MKKLRPRGGPWSTRVVHGMGLYGGPWAGSTGVVHWPESVFCIRPFNWKAEEGRKRNHVLTSLKEKKPIMVLPARWTTMNSHNIFMKLNLPSLDLTLYDDPPSAEILLSMVKESPYLLCWYASEPLLRSWTETWPALKEHSSFKIFIFLSWT